MNQYSSTPSGKKMPENTTEIGMNTFIKRWTVAAVPTGAVVWRDVTRYWVRNVALALMIVFLMRTLFVTLVLHEQQAWSRYLRSARDSDAKRDL